MDTPDQGHTRRPRNSQGRYTARPGTAERDAQACRLRTRGESYDQIARALGFRDRSGARRAVQRALVVTRQEPADELRALELERLDDLTRHLQQVLATRHFVHTQGGKVVRHPETGTPLTDTGPVIQAALALLRVSESRRKLTGADEPAKQRVQVITEDMVDAAIAGLTGQLNAMGEPLPGPGD